MACGPAVSPSESSGKITGDSSRFERLWSTRPETTYNHWMTGRPRNQIQFAFRNHWEVFRELLRDTQGRACLEVGCGRGSISSYFAQYGYACTLLDYSATVLQSAKVIFSANRHGARFTVGDVLRLPFLEESFDVVVSIGLLEHFDVIGPPLAEQVRVLRPGGTLLAYIVPEKQSIQRYFEWLNAFLRAIHRVTRRKLPAAGKEPLFRTSFDGVAYRQALRDLPVEQARVTGMYPLPLISHSPGFPFSLMHPAMEEVLTAVFRGVLGLRRLLYSQHPWTCSEGVGQAFLLVCRRPDGHG